MAHTVSELAALKFDNFALRQMNLKAQMRELQRAEQDLVAEANAHVAAMRKECGAAEADAYHPQSHTFQPRPTGPVSVPPAAKRGRKPHQATQPISDVSTTAGPQKAAV